MLDFYKIDDDAEVPEWPEIANLEFIDGLTLDDFYTCHKFKLFDKNQDFWTDFRWKNSKLLEIEKSIQVVIPKLINDTSVISINRLYLIIKIALKYNVGIVAYCD